MLIHLLSYIVHGPRRIRVWWSDIHAERIAVRTTYVE